MSLQFCHSPNRLPKKKMEKILCFVPCDSTSMTTIEQSDMGPACEIISHKNSVQWGTKSKLEVDSFKCLLIFEFLLRAMCSTGSWWHMLIPNRHRLCPPEPYSLVTEIDSSQSTLQVRWNVSLSQQLREGSHDEREGWSDVAS